jgi:predicted molibdopterin-dependent oxidoreductase YjgC
MATVNIFINGKPVEAAAGSTILKTATAAGVFIPTFCHADNLKPFTSCFICAVKVEPGRGNLVPACATKVAEGQKIAVDGEEVEFAGGILYPGGVLEALIAGRYGADCVKTHCPLQLAHAGFAVPRL